VPGNIRSRDHFRQAYEGQPPWDIGRPQPVFVEAAGQITGSVIDAGCGTGENALFFAERGRKVTGIDYLEQPIVEARRKAQQRNLPATFLVVDALRLEELGEAFDSVIDCGLFHVFSDADRARYVKGLASVARPAGRLFLLCFSDQEPPGDGPRRVSQQELHEAFANGWTIESIQAARFEVRPDLEGIKFSEGGPMAWFCVIRRSGQGAGS
jgi:SAM-dependent methyltransferase